MKNTNKYIYYQMGNSYVAGIITTDYGNYCIYKALETNATTWVIGHKYYAFLDRVIIADSLEHIDKIRTFQ